MPQHGWSSERTRRFCLAGARAERARGEGTRPHPKTAKRRRYVAQKISAARAATVVGDRAGDIHAQPVAAEFAHWIDALHGQAGQVLHSFTSVAAWPGQLHGKQPSNRRAAKSPEPPGSLAARRGPPKENAWPEDPQLRPRTGDRAGTANLMARILP